MNWIAIDLGSTNTKMAVLDLEKREVVEYSRFPVNARKRAEGYFYEIDAEAYFNDICGILSSVLPKIKGSECGVRITTQMHGFVLTDDNGVPAIPYISWQDRRSQRMSAEGTDFEILKRKLGGGIKAESGSSLKISSAVSNGFSMIRREEISRNKRFEMHTLGSYMLKRLCGAYCTHLTNACPLGTARVREQCWDQNVIAAAEMEKWKFPRIANEHERIGEARICGKHLLFYPDLGDQQAAVLGAMREKNVEININVATAGQAARVIDQFQTGEFETRPFFESSYLSTFTGLPAGRNLEVLTGLIQDIGQLFFKQKLSEEKIYQGISERLLKENQTGGLRESLKYFEGKGAIWGITADNFHVAELYGSAYEELAKIYGERIKQLNEDGSANCVVATGGVLEKNDILYQIFQKKCPLILRKSLIKDSVIAGHARLALVDEGEANSIFEPEILTSQLKWR